MRKLNLVLFLSAIMVFSSCNMNKESGNEVMYEYDEEKTELSVELKNRIGSWAEEGKVCYGCVVSVDGSGIPILGKVVKAKILKIKGDSLKMKALESVSVAEGEQEGCSKMGLSKGETWWETDGDLFQTKDEAEAFLNKKNLLK
jgi:hypothetical protein